MKILKLKGKREENILKEIEKEYGESAVVLSTQKEEQTGIARWVKSPKTVITIAVKDDEDVELSTNKQPKLDVQNTDYNKSYDVLLELKDKIDSLQEEVVTIKRNSNNANITDKDSMNKESGHSKWQAHIYNQLVQIGIKEDICKTLFASSTNTELEDIVGDVYSGLEEILEETKEEVQEREEAQVIFFIGSTGVGKTTTLAKLTAKYVLEEQKKVVLLTADTYRIAAVEQLKTYADILGVQLEVIYNESELPMYIDKWKDMDYIIVDTAGRSHKNEEQVTELRELMGNVVDKKAFLVLNVNTAPIDVLSIVNTYSKVTDEFSLILTKLDETDSIGNLVNISHYANHPISYTTNGQNVPDDIAVFNKNTYITDLLGRIDNE